MGWESKGWQTSRREAKVAEPERTSRQESGDAQGSRDSVRLDLLRVAMGGRRPKGGASWARQGYN